MWAAHFSRAEGNQDNVSGELHIKPLAESDRPWAHQVLIDSWGSILVVTRGILRDLSDAAGFVAWYGGERVGLITYRLDGDECEITTLDSQREGIGAGSALLAAVQDMARAAGCRRVWLLTTNDNLHALRFYQRRGYHLAALYPNALEESRRLKPEIPLIGLDGIPLRDEIVLEMHL